MIRVIKEGSINWKKCTCPDCQTEFEYTLSSTSIDYDRMNYNGGITGMEPRKVYCQVCNCEIKI